MLQVQESLVPTLPQPMDPGGPPVSHAQESTGSSRSPREPSKSSPIAGVFQESESTGSSTNKRGLPNTDKRDEDAEEEVRIFDLLPRPEPRPLEKWPICTSLLQGRHRHRQEPSRIG